MESIEIYQCEIESIDEDTFSQTLSMTDLNFTIYNLRTFIQRNKHDWLNNLNLFSLIELENCVYLQKLNLKKFYFNKIYLIFNDLNKEYDFPDEDFCRFKYYPQNRFIFPLIHTKIGIECTCTLTWLLLNHKLNNYFELNKNKHFDLNTTSVYKCFENFQEKISECNFTHRLLECGVITKESNYYFNCSFEQKLNDSNCVRKLIEITLMLIVLILGFPLIATSFYALIRTELKENMFKYLRIQIGFEALSILTLIFNVSIKFSSDIFINSFDYDCEYDFRSDNRIFQIFKYKVINFITYFSISCGLLANLLMVLDRFLMITNNKKLKSFSKIKKINTLVLPMIIIFGFILNFHQIEFSESFQNKIKDYFTLRLRLYFFEDSFYVLVGLVSLCINIKLLIFLYKANSKKSNMISNRRNRNESNEKLVKTAILVVLNCSLIITTRIPDFILSYRRINMFVLLDDSVLSIDDNLGESMDSMFRIFLILINFSFILNFFINFYFNNKFKIIFCSLFRNGSKESSEDQIQNSRQ
ncbi:unnamed protein product [Brachionus calyciflorus]|uniref:G-protein coupled receptors family 1 profile domain-containing protein n=1 Tax=Brachionus calyciflorus TaxID=104777 RepID=A0A813RF86_9BILA|nr:unnamed protein product [Brachionus calyciflorus]